MPRVDRLHVRHPRHCLSHGSNKLIVPGQRVEIVVTNNNSNDIDGELGRLFLYSKNSICCSMTIKNGYEYFCAINNGRHLADDLLQ